jgi:hypothetical protein
MAEEKSWADDIEAALLIADGAAHLEKIYELVGIIRVAGGRSLPRTLRATIRCQLQRNRKFISDTKGIWRLQPDLFAEDTEPDLIEIFNNAPDEQRNGLVRFLDEERRKVGWVITAPAPRPIKSPAGPVEIEVVSKKRA